MEHSVQNSSNAIPESHPENDYTKWDAKQKSISFTAPAGFTGQGCIWYANTAPAGWLICDGSLVAKADYPQLWLLLQNTWGTSTTDKFYLPDLRQRVPVGKHSSGTFSTLNGAGGSESHTLTIGQLPNVTGSITPHGSEGGSFLWSPQGVFGSSPTYGAYKAPPGSTGGASSISRLDFNLGGGGQSHNNLQPYRVVNFIIKT